MLTRREFTALALSTLAWPKLLAQSNTVAGVTLGAQTYSFRQMARPAGGDMVDVPNVADAIAVFTVSLEASN